MKKFSVLTLILISLAFVACHTDEPSHPNKYANKSPEAQQLMLYFDSIYGKQMLTGTTACVNWNTHEALWVYQHTGKYPAINTFDFIHDVWSSKGGWIDYSNPAPVLEWAEAGGIVSMMWHFSMLNNAGTDYIGNPGTADDQTSFRPSCIYDTTSTDYHTLITRIDQVCEWIKPIAALGIPILWRPYHEAQGNWKEDGTAEWQRAWFWWGIDGPEVFKDLWRVTYDRMVNYHGLNNLIWVFTFGDSYRWYPGDEYVDILGQDSYNCTAEDMANWMTDHIATYPNKKFAVTECGSIDNMSEVWNAGGKFLFFSVWYDYGTTCNPTAPEFQNDHANFSEAQWQDAWSQPYILSREDIPNFNKH